MSNKTNTHITEDKKEDKHPLEKVVWGIIPIVNYFGKLVTRLIGGYEIMGQKVKTPQEVDEVILKAEQSVSNSIVK